MELAVDVENGDLFCLNGKRCASSRRKIFESPNFDECLHASDFRFWWRERVRVRLEEREHITLRILYY